MSVKLIKDFDVKNEDESVVYVLDTNVLFWVHSGYFIGSNMNDKVSEYSNLLQNLIENNRKVVVTSLNLQELFHVIEDKEYNLFLSSNSLNKFYYGKKKFRGEASNRIYVKNKIESVYAELSPYNIIDCDVRRSDIEVFLSSYTSHLYDPIDYASKENSKQKFEKIVFVSDDSDFKHDSEIDILTYK